MSMMVQSGRFGGGGGGLLPYAFTIPGKDAESGTTDWTMVQNSIGVRTGVAGFTTNCFFGGNFSTSRARHIFYDIPAGAFTQADAGSLEIALEFLYVTLNTDADDGRFYFEFYDAAAGGGNFIGSSVLPPTGTAGFNSDILTTETATAKVPAGTRSLSFGYIGNRNSGTELSFYWEMNSLILKAGVGHRAPALHSDFLVSTANAVLGWTVTTGAIAGSVQVGVFGFTERFGGSQAGLQYTKNVSIPSVASTAVAAGTATARLRRMAMRTNAGDRSRTYCEFLDAGSSVVGTVEDASTPNAWTTTPTLAEFTLAIPATAVSARMGFHFQRADGTVLDARVAMAEVGIEW